MDSQLVRAGEMPLKLLFELQDLFFSLLVIHLPVQLNKLNEQTMVKSA